MAECRQRNHGLALSLIEKYRMQPESLAVRKGSILSLSVFCRNYGLIILNELRGMDRGVLGHIAAQGLSLNEGISMGETSIADVEMAMVCVYDIGANPESSGMDQLIHLAAMSLVGEVFDILSRRFEAMRLSESTREVELQMH